VFTATANGSYAVAITQNGCTDTSGCFVILSTGINGSLTNQSFTIYPNPTNDFIFISTGSSTTALVEVMNVSGAIVQSAQFTGTGFAMNLSELASGMYFVKLTTAQGSEVRKIWKE
jgi:hypothetical protein